MSKQSNQSNQPSQSALTIEELRQRLLDQLSLEQKIIEELSDEELNVVTSGVSLGESGHIPEELSELDMQAVNGGYPGVGNTLERSASASSGSSHYSDAIGETQQHHPRSAAPAPGIQRAWLASASGLVAGGVASFVVGGIAGKLSVSG